MSPAFRYADPMLIGRKPHSRRVAGPKKLQANRAELLVIAERCAAATGGNAGDVWERLVAASSTSRKRPLPSGELDAASFRALELARMPEQGRGGLQQYVKNRIDIANRLAPRRADKRPRFLDYHTFNSEKSDPGFPDVILMDRTFSVLHVWELKAEDGEPSELQTWWLEAFEELGGAVRWLIESYAEGLADRGGVAGGASLPAVEARLIRPSDVVYIDAALGLS